PVGRTQQVQRIDTPHGLEQTIHLMGEAARLTSDLSRKQRLCEDIESEKRHIARDIDRSIRIFVFFDESLAALQHWLGETGDMAWCEDWSHGFARALPDLALGRQQPVAQDRSQDLLTHARHLVVPGIVYQHMAD